MSDQLSIRQRAAIDAAKRAHLKLERADAAYKRAQDERTAAIRAALAADVSYGELAQALGVPRGTVQAAKLRGERQR